MKKDKLFLQLLLIGILISVIYVLWAIQPQSLDEWVNPVSKLFKPHPWPHTGQEIRYVFSGYNYLITSPFSLFKPYTLLTSIAVVLIIWAALSREVMAVRFFLTLLTVLGFPYLGHVGPWNIAASHYTVALLWAILWYVFFKHLQKKREVSAVQLVSLFMLSFLASVWHEVWLISFAVISAYMAGDWFLYHRKDKKSTAIALVVVAGYMLALWFYTKGGPKVFIYQRAPVLGASTLLSPQHLLFSICMGFKETTVLLKDCLPLFALTAFIALKKESKLQAGPQPWLLLAAAVGSILLLFVNFFILGAPQWRTRWLCVFPIVFTAYTFATPLLGAFKLTLAQKSWLRPVFLAIAVVFLSYNAYRTYVFNNVDVKSWLMYRELVINRDPRALEGVCPATLPAGRPRGCAFWYNTWGAEDDRYRYFFPPDFDRIKKTTEAYWQGTKS